MSRVQESKLSSSAVETLLDSFPDLILSLNNEGAIIHASKELQNLLGYNQEEVLGKKLSDFFFDPLGKEKMSAKRYECRLQTKGGSILPVEIRSFSTDSATAPCIVMVRDIHAFTEKRWQYFQNGKLAALNEVAPSLIHDIRNALSVLGAQHYFMKHNVEKLDTEKFLGGLDIIQKASMKIEKITNQLRELVQAEENSTNIFLRDLVDDCIFLLEPRTRKIQAKIYNFIPLETEFNCVPLQIEQVFLHLLNNAIDAVSTSGEKKITISLEPSPDSLVVSVRDSGVGVDAKIKEQIFDSFFTTKAKGEGTGLGLYVAKQLVGRHGGSIKLTSEGDGSIFTLTFPVQASH